MKRSKIFKFVPLLIGILISFIGILFNMMPEVSAETSTTDSSTITYSGVNGKVDDAGDNIYGYVSIDLMNNERNYIYDKRIITSDLEMTLDFNVNEFSIDYPEYFVITIENKAPLDQDIKLEAKKDDTSKEYLTSNYQTNTITYQTEKRQTENSQNESGETYTLTINAKSDKTSDFGFFSINVAAWFRVGDTDDDFVTQNKSYDLGTYLSGDITFNPEAFFDNVFFINNCGKALFNQNGAIFTEATGVAYQEYTNYSIATSYIKSGYNLSVTAYSTDDNVLTIGGNISNTISGYTKKDAKEDKYYNQPLEFNGAGKVSIIISLNITYVYKDANGNLCSVNKTLNSYTHNFISYKSVDDVSTYSDFYLALDDTNLFTAAQVDLSHNKYFSIDTTSVLKMKSNFISAYDFLSMFSYGVTVSTDSGSEIYNSNKFNLYDEEIYKFSEFYSYRTTYQTTEFVIKVTVYDNLFYDLTSTDRVVFDITFNVTLANNELPEYISTDNTEYEFSIAEEAQECEIQIKNYEAIISVADIAVTSTNKDIEAYISDYGYVILTPHHPGTTYVTITAIDAKAKTISKTIKVTITQEEYLSGFDKSSISVVEGGSVILTYGYFYENEFNAESFTYGIPEVKIGTSKNKINASYEFNSNYNLIVKVEGVLQGTDAVYLYLADYEVICYCKVTVTSAEITEDELSKSFTVGDKVTFLLDDQDTHYLTVDDDNTDASYTFISYDTSVVKIQASSGRSCEVILVGEGETTIFAYYSIQSSYISYTATIDVNVIKEAPEISLIIEADSNIINYTDTFIVKIDSSSFTFSDIAIIRWYIDGILKESSEEAMEYSDSKKLQIVGKMTAGDHIVKVTISDEYYSLNLSAQTKINVSDTITTKQELSLASNNLLTIYKDNIYLDINGSSLVIKALVNGNENTNLTYLFSIGDSDLLMIDTQSENKIIIKPLAVGETTITVMTNIGNVIDNFISTDIKVTIVEVNDLVLTYNSADYKPGTKDALFRIEGVTDYGNYDVANMDLTLSVKINEDTQTNYYRSGNTLVFDELSAATYRFNARYNDLELNTNYEVTNFNIAKFAKQILPFLLVILLVIVLAIVMTKISGKDMEVTLKKCNKFKSFIEANKNFNDDNKKSIMKKSVSYANKIKSSLEYNINSGYDECTTITPFINKICDLCYSVTGDEYKAVICNSLLENINQNELKKIISMLEEYIETRKEFNKKHKEDKDLDDKIIKKNKKEKKMLSNKEVVEYIGMEYAESYDVSEEAQNDSNETEQLDNTDKG